MNSFKNKILVLLVAMAVVIAAIKHFTGERKNVDELKQENKQQNWRTRKLIYTKHAKCRMDCREITAAEVEYILKNGLINEAKSHESTTNYKAECPTYALEGTTNDGQHVRVVFGDCADVTKVITVIDLGVEHDCNCK